MFRIVRELFFMKEGLLPGTEHELPSALDALENAIGTFHGMAPFPEKSSLTHSYLATCRPGSLVRGKLIYSNPARHV